MAMLCTLGFLFGSCNTGSETQLADVDIPEALPITRTAADVIQETGVEEWSFVYIGDCYVRDFSRKLVPMFEEDLNIRINPINWYVGGDHSSYLANKIQNNDLFRDNIRNADIIIIEIPWNVFEEPSLMLTGQRETGCEGMTPEECLEQATQTYISDTGLIFKELSLLTDPSDTLIRAVDTYQFHTAQIKEAGVFDIINDSWKQCNANVEKEAARYGIPTVKVYDTFMGEDNGNDPEALGLLEDGRYQTDAGSTLIAELVREMGYEYSVVVD